MPAKKSTKPAEKPAAKTVEKTSTKPAAAAPIAKKAPAAKAPPAKKPALMSGSSLIDTNLAASAAAAFLGAGLNRRGSDGSVPESAMFKQMKSGLNKPHSTAMNNLLDKSQGPDAKKSAIPFGKQSGHSQTKSDVARINVPRRTAG